MDRMAGSGAGSTADFSNWTEKPSLKMTFKGRIQGSKETSHAAIQREILQGEGTAKAKTQGRAGYLASLRNTGWCG